jgi:hypothetical protein
VKAVAKFEKIRVVAFATKKGHEMLGKSKKWYVDGTFKAVPTMFTRLVTIHTKYLGRHWPFVHALCSSKSKETLCIATLRVVLARWVPRPRSINVDFELAIIYYFRINNIFLSLIQYFFSPISYSLNPSRAHRLKLVCQFWRIPECFEG